MTAVSQSYPNYLGGLNEQPDELMKPGQLVEALNVIPDPVVGLTRRPGFKLLDFTGDSSELDPGGTWFEMKLPNQRNSDYMYIGCISGEGRVTIFNQDGVIQTVLYTDKNIRPHLSYEYDEDSGELIVYDENDERVYDDDFKIIPDETTVLPYLDNEGSGLPLKTCVSKDHVIIANPVKVPKLASIQEATSEDERKYYSFINLKVIDTDNYNYTFTRFYADENKQTYKYIRDVELTKVEDLSGRGDWGRDLTLPLQINSPYQFELDGPGVIEKAVVEVEFRGQVVQVKSDGGDGYYNQAVYSWNTKIISPGKGFEEDQEYKAEIEDPDKDDLELTFTIKEVQQVTATKNKVIVVDDISNNNSATDILLDLRDKFEDAGINKAVVVGSGLYLENNIEFSVSTDEIAVADVINSQKMDDDIVPIARVNTVAELPIECYSGFIVEVTNSFDDKNNYYLKYTAESETPDDIQITKADGYWEEVAKPFERHDPNNGTMPHIITAARVKGSSAETVFVVSPMGYVRRTAGTAKDNPSMFNDEAPITGLSYYKNRLFFFTNIGTVISSRAGEIANLFLSTALTVSAIDPIDLIANSNQRVPIYESSVVNNGMVLFGDSEQYNLSTKGDVLSPQTVNITKISNYTFDRVSNPIYVGTNIGFISSGLTRFYEMTNVYDSGPIDINERSQQIQTQFSLGFNMPSSSREQSIALVYKRHTDTGSPDIMMYRFRQENSQQTTQTSWVRWRVPFPVCYITQPRDKVFVVVNSDNGCQLYTMGGDSLQGLPPNPGSLPFVPTYMDGYNDNNPGHHFETKISFPTIYPRGKESYDITSNVTIHRVKLSTSAIGVYNLEIKRKGYDTYNILVEQTPADDGEWGADILPLRGEHIETVPIYTRNKNLTFTMSNKTPDGTLYDAPLTLHSMTWEGDWNPPYYKRV